MADYLKIATRTKRNIMAKKKDTAAPKKEELKNIAELEKKIAELEKTGTELSAAVESGKSDYIRLMAEFDTFRRRTAEEKLNLVASAASETIKGLLPVLDDCEIALEQLKKSSDSAAAIEGTELIYNKLMAYLKSKGLSVIEAKGQVFDTDFHEAVTQFPAPDEDMKGKVIDVVQTGYMLGDKVLRYAKVVVGA